MSRSHEELAQVLVPVAPPRVIEGVYSDDEYERIVRVIKDNGPWPGIASHHFETVDELIATVTGIAPENHGLTLDDIASAHFRGFFAQNSVLYYPELHDIFYNQRFLAEVTSYWSAQYAKPTMMLFNICGAHNTGLDPHLDAVNFRGVRYENTPVWILNMMGKSGLFTDYLLKMAQVITWWYKGPEGTFTYWPDGPHQPPKVLDHPLWNKGVVVQNELMFHRGDPVGAPDQRDIPGLKHRSRFGYDPDHDDWAITTDGVANRRYANDEVRLLVHWSAEVFADLDEHKLVMDHTDDLTHDRVVETFLADMAARGRRVDVGPEPFKCNEFIRALMETYDVAPTIDWIPRAS